ncbi:TfoX/Sxy family protein [Raoultibacter timonensis]|uniref:Competence protein TfoX n=1 Tax=Raoultibacter timonensis TaxID=1907662 RepID=A0ABN6MGY5_9ACTN|nr:TfoX/Sxy family protein [Raoultibacter timonensis]BDE97270.1 competence protein TfoX [Raoultibacter timonensis]BDF51873.1 competence protein TfoX [Raoultibacter timonensis]
MKLSELPNIGAHAEQQLTEVGIDTAEALIEAGAEQAWLRVKTIDPGVCLHMLYGLEGAVQGIPKKNLSPERKAELKAFFDAEQ